jgi:lipopolysaccharide/colanic/teichoic acid biosynthesis glycosyltransferase
MSLVGPRPLVLTGPWQISGRSHIPFQDMIKFDYQYVAGWSLARDLEILLATLPAVVSGRGAY